MVHGHRFGSDGFEHAWVFVCAVGKYACYLKAMVSLLKEVVVPDEHGNAANGKNGIERAIEGFSCMVCDDEVDDFGEAIFTFHYLLGVDGLHINIDGVTLFEAAHIVDVETEHIFVVDGIFDEVLVEAFAEDILCSAVVVGVFGQYWGSGEAEALDVLKK